MNINKHSISLLILLITLSLSADERSSGNLLDRESATFESKTIPSTIICAWNKTAVRITDAESYRGEKSLELEYGPKTKLFGVYFTVPGAPFKKGETFTVSLYIKASKAARPQIWAYASPEKAFKSLPWSKYSVRTLQSGKWTQMYVTATMKEDTPKLYLYLGNYNYEGKLWIDEVKVEKGSKVSGELPGRIEPSVSKKKVNAFPVTGKTLNSLNAPSWQNLPVHGPFVPEDGKTASALQQTVIQYAADQNYLYFRFKAQKKNMSKVVCHSTWTKPDWNDERVELHFQPGLDSNVKKQHISVNADGIFCSSFDGLVSPRDVQVKRRNDGYEVFIRLKKEWFGTNADIGHLWKMNAGRFQRISLKSALFPFQNHFKDSLCTFVFTRNGKSPDIYFYGAGVMREYANAFGGNRFLFEFPGQVPKDLTLVAQDGQRLTPRQTNTGRKRFFFYNMKDGRNISYKLFSGNNELSRGKFNPGLYCTTGSASIPPVKNPVFEDLLGVKREKPRVMLTWPLMLNEKDFRAALKTATPYSYDETLRELKKANISILSNNVKKLLPYLKLKKMYCNHFWIQDGEPDPISLTEGVKSGKNVPFAYYNNSIITGKNDKGWIGISREKNGLRGMLIDSINADAYLEYSERYAAVFGENTRIFFPGDELVAMELATQKQALYKPFNIKNSSGFVQKFEAKVKNEYGKGKYGIYYKKSPKDTDFKWCKLATTEFVNEKITSLMEKTRTVVKKHAPEIIMLSDDAYLPANHMVCNWNRYADCGSIQVGEGEREKDHCFPWQMYRTKITRDLSLLDELVVVPHAPVDGYPYGSLSPEEILESYSQMIRGGATGFHFYPHCLGGPVGQSIQPASIVLGDPVAWQYMIGVTTLFNKLPELKFPDGKENAILFSEASEIVYDKTKRCEGAFNQLGVYPHGWFSFVSETLLERGKINLNDYKRVFIPHNPVSSRKMISILDAFVEQGGSLVIADPEHAKLDHWNNSLKSEQEKLYGIARGAPYQGLVSFGKAKFHAPNGSFKIEKYPRDAKILATYADGSPAAVEFGKGKGKIAFFAFPVTDFELSKNDKVCVAFWQYQKELGVKGGFKIWNFKLPKPENIREIKSPEGLCLTGNHALWERCFFYTAAKNNVPEKYSVSLDGKKTTRLTDRLDNFKKPDDFKRGSVEVWLERIKTGKHEILVDFEKSVEADMLTLYVNGFVPNITVLADGQFVGKVTSFRTGKRDVAKLDVPFNSRKTRSLKLLFDVPVNEVFTCIEVEVWKK